MAYEQIAGRGNLRNSAVDFLTDYEKKKPKVTKKTEVNKNATVDGVTGTLKTLTTTTNTPGSTGKPFSSLPKNIQAEAREYRKNNPSTPAKTNVDVKTRFTPNASKLDSSGPAFSQPELKANLSNIEKLATTPKIKQYYHHRGSNAHNMRFGGHTTTSNTTSPNGNFSGSYTKSPSNTISGKSNTTSSVPFTQAQNMAVHAGYRIGQGAPPSDKVANAFVAKQTEKVQKRALAKYNKKYN